MSPKGNLFFLGTKLSRSPGKTHLSFLAHPFSNKCIFLYWFYLILSLEVRTFAEDFPEIVRKRHEKKNAKREKLHERRQYWNHLATKNYEKLIIACSDLVFHRRGIRKAFNKWLETLGLKSKAVASIEKFSIEIDNDANIIDQAKLKEQKKQLK